MYLGLLDTLIWEIANMAAQQPANNFVLPVVIQPGNHVAANIAHGNIDMGQIIDNLRADDGKGVLAPPFTHNRNYSRWLADNELAPNQSNAEVWIFTCLTRHQDTVAGDLRFGCRALHDNNGALLDANGAIAAIQAYHQNNNAWQNGVQSLDVALTAGDIEALYYEAPTYNADITRAHLMTAARQFGGAMRRFTTLVGCTQAKVMVEKNFTSFYASKNLELNVVKIMQIVRFAATLLPRVTEEIRSAFRTESFVQYHTTGYSTPGLLMKMIGTLGDDCGTVFKLNHADTAAIQACLDDRRDQNLANNLSTNCRCTLFAFLRVYDLFPDKYYWGEKAEAELPPSVYVKYRSVMKRYKELKSNIQGIEQMNLAALVNALN